MREYETRIDMISDLICSSSIGAEVGVFKGDFSQQLADLGKVDKLYLCDTFSGIIGSGNVDGNNYEEYNGDKLYDLVTERFANNEKVVIKKLSSYDFLHSFDRDLNFVYIDANHGYASVMQDLVMAKRALKTGGWIFGHDYDVNPAKQHTVWPSEVKKAVNDFCLQYNLVIDALAMDGWTSFGIRNG